MKDFLCFSLSFKKKKKAVLRKKVLLRCDNKWSQKILSYEISECYR